LTLHRSLQHPQALAGAAGEQARGLVDRLIAVVDREGAPLGVHQCGVGDLRMLGAGRDRQTEVGQDQVGLDRPVQGQRVRDIGVDVGVGIALGVVVSTAVRKSSLAMLRRR
jgi:hypothetical protein